MLGSIIGKTRKNSKGEVMTIIAFRNGKVDVLFSDGNVRKRVGLARFHQGRVHSPKYFIGKKRKNRRGEEITLVRLYNWNNVTVAFPDGSIRKRVNYLNFLTGRVLHPEDSLRSDCIGELRPNSVGEWMRIIDYRNLWDLDVQFTDGTVRKGIDYYQFETGHVFKVHKAAKCYRVGESSIARNGETMIITAYRNSQDLDVQFPDGTIRKGVTYHNFQIGAVCKIKGQRKERVAL